jgi:hypothetical protein
LEIWFNGKIDSKNGHVISSKLRRIGQQQQEELNKEGDVQYE